MNIEPSGEPRILIAEEDRSILELLSARLNLEGYRVDTVADGRTTLVRIEQDPLDLVILGLYMPYLGGLTILEQIRRSYEQTELPVVMLVDQENREDIAQALSKGANDCIPKPINFDTTLARINTQIQLLKQYQKIHTLLQTDPESGLFNRDFLCERLDEELARLERYGGDLTVMTISFVPVEGDLDRPLVRSAAETLQSTCRSSDILGRLDNNRFGLILTETAPTNSMHVKQRLEKALAEAGLMDILDFTIKTLDDNYEGYSAEGLLEAIRDEIQHEEPKSTRNIRIPEEKYESDNHPETTGTTGGSPENGVPDSESGGVASRRENLSDGKTEQSEPADNSSSHESESSDSTEEEPSVHWYNNLLDVILMNDRGGEKP